MKRFAPLLILALAVLCLTACGSSDPHERAIEDILDSMEELTELLGQVKDRESVEKMGPKIEKVSGELADTLEQMRDLEKPTPEKDAELKKKYDTRMKEARKALDAEKSRLRKELDADSMLLLSKSFKQFKSRFRPG